jgi:predicted GH43/DUF377 family glycosyl hydrolase
VNGAVRQRRVLSRGDIPGSDGGIYNPGAMAWGGAIVLLCRREIDLRFSRFVHAERVILDPDTLAVREHRTLRRRGYPEEARIEDFRCLTRNGAAFCIHTLIHAGRIRPLLSRFDEFHIEPCDAMELPFRAAPVEKNWVLFEHDGALHCLYRLDPLTVLRCEADHKWRLLKREENGWADECSGTLSNSCNLIAFMDGYLGFWHSIVGGRYVQGALLLGADLCIRYRTGVLLDGQEVTAGYKPGVLYVSGLVRVGQRILAFYGEGDSHTGVAEFDAAELAAELRRNPFQPAPVLRVRFTGTRMGDLYRAMMTLRGLSREHGEPRIRLYVGDPGLASAVAVFGVPKVALRRLEEATEVDLDLS